MKRILFLRWQLKYLHYANVIQPLELTCMDLYVYRHIYVCITYVEYKRNTHKNIGNSLSSH